MAISSCLEERISVQSTSIQPLLAMFWVVTQSFLSSWRAATAWASKQWSHKMGGGVNPQRTKNTNVGNQTSDLVPWCLFYVLCSVYILLWNCWFFSYKTELIWKGWIGVSRKAWKSSSALIKRCQVYKALAALKLKRN